jgi:16S rRNA processing protein RimM
MKSDYFATARIGAPFGLDGRFKVESLSGETAHILALKTVRVVPGTNPSKKAAGTISAEYAVEAAYENPLSLKLKGIDSPEAAKALKGAEIVVPRAEAAPLEPGEFYIEDLKGLEVYEEIKTTNDTNDTNNISEGRKDGNPSVREVGEVRGFIGKITDIIEGGGGFLAEVELASGEKRLIPFREEFFGQMRPETGRLVLKNTWILDLDGDNK